MYLEFFGLREPPFRITPNTGFFFSGGSRGAILDALVYAIAQGEGIVKVSGEVGSGKTMLCRMLQARLPAHVQQIYLANPSVSPAEILHAIAHELECPIGSDASRLQVMQAITRHLLECHATGRQVVLFVEESQSMPLATLEEIRLLSNLETDHHKLMQIVLFGQPELDAILLRPDIRQLRERITHAFDLAPLSPAEIGEYLDFRLRAAGYRGPALFPPGVVRTIARASAGLTRRVNLLADKTLLAAFAGGTHAITARHVRAAVADSEFARRQTLSPRLRLAVAAAGAAALAATVTALLLGPGAGSSSTAPPASPPSPAPAADRAAGTASAPTPRPATVSPGGDAGRRLATPPAAGAGSREATEYGPGAGRAAADAPAPAGTRAEATTPEPDSGLLAVRLAATRVWLERAASDTVTLQLLTGRDERHLQRQLPTLGAALDTQRLWVMRSRLGGQPVLLVLHGEFASIEAARAAIATLPPTVRAWSPQPRTVQGLRAELAAAGS